MATIIKTAQQIEKMRVAGRLGSEVLDYITPFVQAGVTTGELNQLCLDYMTQVQKSISATIGYAPPGYPPYPGAMCTSLNEVVCHGIPGPDRLKDGDILNIDVTVIKDGFHGDNSRMFYIGTPSLAAKRLCEVTYECMWLGIEMVKPGARLGDIGYVIQRHAEGHGYSVVREYCGHGVGEKFHEDPQVVHYGRPATGEVLRPGMIFTIEPMINQGRREVKELSGKKADGWTIVTKDRSLSAQWEHTILVTETGYEVLTQSAGSPAPPSFVGRAAAALATASA